MEKYEFSTHSVSISLPERALVTDVTFPVTIEATHKFGGTVQGEATVTFYINYPRDIYVGDALDIRQYRTILFTKTLQINSSAVSFDVNIRNELKIYGVETVNAEVVFTKTPNAKKVAAIGVIYIAEYDYELLITSNESNATTYNLTVSMRQTGTGVPVSNLFFFRKSNLKILC